jgi:hypothetical protein
MLCLLRNVVLCTAQNNPQLLLVTQTWLYRYRKSELDFEPGNLLALSRQSLLSKFLGTKIVVNSTICFFGTRVYEANDV